MQRPGERIPQAILGDRHVAQADLLPVVEEGSPAQGEQHHRRQPGARLALPRVVGIPGAGVTAGVARDVVVREHQVGPGPGRQRGLEALHLAAEGGGVERRAEEREVEGQVQLVVLAVVGGRDLGVEDVDLPHRHALGIGVDHPADVAQEGMHVGMVLVVVVSLPAVAVPLATR